MKGPKPTPIGPRFWGRAKVREGCWEFPKNGGPHRSKVYYQGKHWVASQLAYRLIFGPIPAGMCVCHHCDNPQCINPWHLFLGTHLDNMQDRQRKGRTAKPPVRWRRREFHE